MLLVDLYTYKGINSLLVNTKYPGFRKFVRIAYWTVSSVILVAVFIGYFFRGSTRNLSVFTAYYYLFGAFVVFYTPKILFVVFHLFDDVIYAVKWAIRKLRNTRTHTPDVGTPITRNKFLSQAGLVLASVPFFSFIWGIAKGRFNFKIEPVTVKFPNLPKNFDGLKIVQISDLHIGSFNGFEGQVEDAINLVNAQEPDILFFTGDLVNNFADELNDFMPTLTRMKAKYGKYSTLGNHDYGNYYKEWKSAADKEQNFERIKHAHDLMGFRLLNNEAEVLEFSGEKIAIIGVENWGLRPFPQRGDYELASRDVKDIPFKILLSHDPTHWDLKIVNKHDVDLTLSGHTHGYQFGVHIAGFKWSPAQYRYKHWAGLYSENNQYLYVNVGLGSLGYPGRVGMPPEITQLILKCGN